MKAIKNIIFSLIRIKSIKKISIALFLFVFFGGGWEIYVTLAAQIEM